MSKNKAKFNNRAFAEKFQKLLRDVPDGYGLAEWQQLYREAMFAMGMHILQEFPEDATRRHHREDKRASGGSGGGGHPSILPCNFVDFPAFVLCLSPATPPG